jgi:DNA-binding CsgD family transcriptional regulator
MNLPSTYGSFLKSIQHHEIGETDELLSGSSKIGSQVNMFFNRAMPACYILDYTRGKYIHATPRMREIIDNPVSRFLEGGLEFATGYLWHKQDLKVFSEKVLTGNLKFLKDIPVAEHADYLFHCNYRVRTKRGDYRNIVQESIFIKSAENGMPLASMGFLHDISDYRNDTRIRHKIMRMNGDNSALSLGIPIIANTYFVNEQDSLLTRREIEILKYLCDNLTSSEIAHRLNISKHTVDNHRRNLLEKTNIKSTVGLVKFAIDQGYV